MKAPYYCPYCEQVSTRKGNLSTHIQRKHTGEFNPLLLMKESNCNFSPPKRAEPFNVNLPQKEFDLAHLFENSKKFQNVLQEIKQWNKLELTYLLYAISNLPNNKNY